MNYFVPIFINVLQKGLKSEYFYLSYHILVDLDK